jgi:hypothetical protein
MKRDSYYECTQRVKDDGDHSIAQLGAAIQAGAPARD